MALVYDFEVRKDVEVGSPKTVKNGVTKKISVGVAIVVFAGLILAGVRSCRWMHDAIIRLEEHGKK